MNWTPDKELRKRLDAWEDTHLGDLANAGRHGQVGRYMLGLRALMEREGNRERAAMLAALAVGPRGRGLPGAGDIVPLIRLAGETPADVLDLVVAWGVGWSRLVWPDHDWHARWVGAVLVLSWLVGDSIGGTVTWLARSVPEFRCPHGERLERLADVIALQLATGRCRCGHDGSGRPAPARPCSWPGHRLDSWRPERCALPVFVATAVRGTAEVPVRAAAFATSMLAALLETDERRLLDNCLVSLAVARTDK